MKCNTFQPLTFWQLHWGTKEQTKFEDAIESHKDGSAANEWETNLNSSQSYGTNQNKEAVHSDVTMTNVMNTIRRSRTIKKG